MGAQANIQPEPAGRDILDSGAAEVWQGDCIKRLAEIPAGSVDLVFADPPFNIGYDYDVYDDRRSADEYLAWSRQWMAGVREALKPNGSFWLAIGDEYAAELKLAAQNDVGFTCRSWIIWYYTFGVNCVRGFSRSHTHLFHFVKDPSDFTFNSENPAVRVMSARQLVYGDNRANPKGRLPDNTWILRPQDAPPGGFAPMHDTWFFSRVAGTFKEREGFHGCQMPEQLLGRIIRISSSPGDLVVDPFSGSGTTLAVARKLGRRCLGIELSTEYVEKIRQRLRKTRVGDPLDGPENALESAPRTGRGRAKVRVRNGRPVPQASEELLQEIAEVFREVADDNSTDVVLCDPDLNRKFAEACKSRNLDGNPFVWNRLLLRVRKTGRLPRSNRSPKRWPQAAMDAFFAGAEIAMHLISVDYGLKLDDILCMPNVGQEFDRLARLYAPGQTGFDYRWAAMTIRKRAFTAKRLAGERFSDWWERALPEPVPLSAETQSELPESAIVYIVCRGNDPIYVGETANLKARAQQLLEAEGWQALQPDQLRIIPVDQPRSRHGLQSLLIGRLNPLLNSSLLRAEVDAPPLSRRQSGRRQASPR